METDRALTPKEVAEILNCHEYTVQDLLREGKLKGFKLNTHWRITKEALIEFTERSPVHGGE